jgi:P27 family predicted phage terminase small subunit
MRGRKPKPTAQRVLEGNPGKRPLNEDEPRPPLLAPEEVVVPAELAANTRAAEEWTRLVPMLQKARQITEADRSALVALCTEWARYLDATARVMTSGMIVKSPSGYPMTNPYLPIARQALAACNRLWPELGLTPSSRSRVKAAPAEPSSDPFAVFDEPIRDATAH